MAKQYQYNPATPAFKDSLYVKSVNGKDYYYCKAETPFIKKEYYVGKYTDNPDIISQYCNKLEAIVIIDSIKEVLKNQKIKREFISDENYIKLELLRFGHYLYLRDFNQKEIEQYDEVNFTRYVYGTTSIEGNTYTLRDTDLTLNKGITVSGKTVREFYEIENYGHLKNYFNLKKSLNFDINLVKKIHSFILKNIDDNYAGEFRKIDVGITGTEFTPVPAIFIEEEMKKLFEFYNKEKDNLYYIERISSFHQRFEEIHPFIDGNGRAGREILRQMLNTYGMPGIFIGPENREEYLTAIDKSNNGNHKAIIGFISKTLVQNNIKLINKTREYIKKYIADNEQLFKEMSICL